MIRSRNKVGFTLIEVMLAIAIIALIITPLFITQGSVLQSVASYSSKLQRIFFAQNFLLTARNASGESEKFSLEKKIDDPITLLKYQMKPIEKKSSLQNMKNLVAEQLTMEWDENGKKRKDVVINYLYKPQKQKKKT